MTIQELLDRLNSHPTESYHAIYDDYTFANLDPVLFPEHAPNPLEQFKEEKPFVIRCDLGVTRRQDLPPMLMPTPEIQIKFYCWLNLPWPTNELSIRVITGETYDNNKCRFELSKEPINIHPEWTLETIYEKAQALNLERHWGTIRRMSNFVDAYREVTKLGATSPENAMWLIEASQKLMTDERDLPTEFQPVLWKKPNRSAMLNTLFGDSDQKNSTQEQKENAIALMEASVKEAIILCASYHEQFYKNNPVRNVDEPIISDPEAFK